MRDGKPERDAAYDKLVGAYYGTPRAIRHPASRRWLARTAEELLAGYYGRQRGSIRPKQATPVSVASSLDDGETLRVARNDSEFEEYVVTRSLTTDSQSDGGCEEYVVERHSGDSLSTGASVSESAPDPQGEYEIDLLDPLVGPAPRDELLSPPIQPKQPDAPVPTRATSVGTSRNVTSPAARESSGASDDDFMADMQSILSGQSQYDPLAKKTVPKEQLSQTPPPPPSPATNSQQIFDKIAASMQYANTYDLGTVELESRFTDFDRAWDSEQKVQEARRTRPAPKSMPAQPEITATTEDFVQDLDSLRRERLERPGLAPSVAAATPGDGIGDFDAGRLDDYGRGTMAGARTEAESASLAMGTQGTALNGAFVTLALQTLFGNASDINTYFAQRGAPDFIGWFNANVVRVGPWANKAIGTSAQTRANFNAIWDRIPQIFGSAQINLLQFLSLMSIFVNEVGGELAPISERVGTKDHPGLAYAFDRIKGIKQSYNADGSNWTAYRCFRDPGFIGAHGQKALGDRLKNTNDQAWAGAVYPAGYPTDVDPALTGFVMEADFYKFRGRGLIQTTWRDAYLNLIKFIQSYSGAQATILARTAAWAGMAADRAANVSSNNDWDDLFMRSDLEVPCIAIAQHNAGAGNYLSLSGDANVLNGLNVPGSIWRVGRAISGSQAYADLFRSRVITICNLLGN